MAGIARLNDEILGVTASEHSGHQTNHGGLTITGNVYSDCSPSVYINGRAVAHINSVTIEYDACCGHSFGVIAEGSPKIFVGGIPVARLNDALAPHNGTAHISSASTDVFCDE